MILLLKISYKSNMSNTEDRVFPHFQTPRRELKYDAQRSIFDKLRGVWKCGQTLSRVFDVFSTKTKEKTEK